jgi:hypothetical protein
MVIVLVLVGSLKTVVPQTISIKNIFRELFVGWLKQGKLDEVEREASVHLISLEEPEAGLLNKSACLAPTLGVTNFIIVTYVFDHTLLCY